MPLSKEGISESYDAGRPGRTPTNTNLSRKVTSMRSMLATHTAPRYSAATAASAMNCDSHFFRRLTFSR